MVGDHNGSSIIRQFDSFQLFFVLLFYNDFFLHIQNFIICVTEVRHKLKNTSSILESYRNVLSNPTKYNKPQYK